MDAQLGRASGDRGGQGRGEKQRGARSPLEHERRADREAGKDEITAAETSKAGKATRQEMQGEATELAVREGKQAE